MNEDYIETELGVIEPSFYFRARAPVRDEIPFKNMHLRNNGKSVWEQISLKLALSQMFDHQSLYRSERKKPF